MPILKLLDFGVIHGDSGQITRPRRIAWPVLGYRVTLPSSSDEPDGDLNPFERVVLKLLEAEGPLTEAKLSEETCIPEDFIKSVLLRLMDNGHINESHEVIVEATGHQSFHGYKPAIVFQEQVTGKLLPFVYYDAKPKISRVDSSSTHVLVMRRSRKHFAPISADDVVRAVKYQKRHARVYGEKMLLPDTGSITVHRTSEEFMLDCSISMREEDGEFRIANPFGKGYSLVLEKALIDAMEADEGLESWLNRWRESVSHDISGFGVESGEEPFDNSWNRRLYPKLVQQLRTNRLGTRSLDRMYSSVEWALFYANERASAARQAISLLQLTPVRDTPRLILEAATSIGIEPPDRGFPRVSGESLDAYLDGSPDMPTALAIAILSARREGSHPLAAYASEHSDVARRLYQMKRERDVRSHGQGRGSDRNEAFMKDIISYLLPEITFEEALSDQERSAEMTADVRFEARTSLIRYFGYPSFNKRLSGLSQERLVDAEVFWSMFSEDEDALPFIGDIYAVLQNELSRRTEPAGIRSSSDEALKSAICERADAFGISPLPSSLTTVRPPNLRKAVQGLDETTLGAVALAFMLTSDEGDMADVITRQESFFFDIGEIIVARGHNNEAREYSKEELDLFREKAYRTIETLIGLQTEEA